MGLFRISRELQFGVCNHGEPRASPLTAREGELFYREEKEVGRALVNRVHGLSLAELLPGKESSFFVLSSVTITGHKCSPFWSPESLIEVSVYQFFTRLYSSPGGVQFGEPSNG